MFVLDERFVPTDPQVELDLRKEDEEEHEAITLFLTNGCQCLADCCHQFTRSHYEVQRNQCDELSHEHLDMVLMGQLMALNPPDKGKKQLYAPRKTGNTSIILLF